MATRERKIELVCVLPRCFMVQTTLLQNAAREHYNIAVVLQLNEILPKLHLIALRRHEMKTEQIHHPLYAY